MASENKRFLIGALVFVLSLIILVSLFNIYYNKRVISQTFLEKREAQFINYEEKTQILFFGDSNTEDSINPLIINNSFNFASSGESYLHRYYKLGYLLNNYQLKLKAIVIPIDLHSLSSSYLDSYTNEWYWKRYLPYEAILKFKNPPSKLRLFLKSRFPVLGNGEDLIKVSLENGGKIVMGQRIIEGDFSKSYNLTAMADEIVDNHFKSSDVISPIQAEYLKKTIELAESKGIKIILVKYPITEEYYNSSTRYIPDKNKYYDKINLLISGCKGCYVLDYQKILFGKEQLFLDANHMNYNGSLVLSPIINEDIQKMVS